jgi:hypothetical protein
MRQTDVLKAVKGMRDEELAALRLLLQQALQLETSVLDND